MGALLRRREDAEGPRRAADGAARAMLPAGGTSVPDIQERYRAGFSLLQDAGDPRVRLI
ncbi:hypothetical protein GTZ93_41905 [Corallococcus exiguus]|uniref:Uncharacterized protein n=1 Tax=Corallococcus exiguus TaxID=83462 RepID=A0A7X4YJD2_9BACT|nr:hypothetical protein [Corallococcus exiguus]